MAPRVVPRIDPNQTAMMEACRRESALDRSIPLGISPQVAKPEIGLIASRYYALKHKRGEYGTYWLHQVQPFRDRSL